MSIITATALYLVAALLIIEVTFVLLFIYL